MMKKSVFSFALLLLSAASLFAQEKNQAAPAVEEHNYMPTVLLEFFSSEGCGSCPFADAFAEEIIRISDSDSSGSRVFLMDFHVDVWNRSGWIDPFSDSNYTNRQKYYLIQNELPAMFTPQVYINGKKGLPGGAKRDIGLAVKDALSKPSQYYIKTGAESVPGQDSILVKYMIWGKQDSLTLNFALVKKEVKNSVTGGENKGKVLTHHNIVTQFTSIPAVKRGGEMKLYVPRGLKLGQYRLITFLQKEEDWEVVAADQILFQ